MMKTYVFLLTLFETGKLDPQKSFNDVFISSVPVLTLHHCNSENRKHSGFPCGTVVKNLTASAGDTGSSPGPGRYHMPRSN